MIKLFENFQEKRI